MGKHGQINKLIIFIKETKQKTFFVTILILFFSPYSHKIQYGNTRSESNLSEHFLVDSEGEVQHVFYVIVLHPLKGLVKLLIQILQVTQVTGTT